MVSSKGISKANYKKVAKKLQNLPEFCGVEIIKSNLPKNWRIIRTLIQELEQRTATIGRATGGERREREPTTIAMGRENKDKQQGLLRGPQINFPFLCFLVFRSGQNANESQLCGPGWPYLYRARRLNIGAEVWAACRGKSDEKQINNQSQGKMKCQKRKQRRRRCFQGEWRAATQTPTATRTTSKWQNNDTIWGTEEQASKIDFSTCIQSSESDSN